MVIIGVDYHPSFQTIAFVVEETGECREQELSPSVNSSWSALIEEMVGGQHQSDE